MCVESIMKWGYESIYSELVKWEEDGFLSNMGVFF